MPRDSVAVVDLGSFELRNLGAAKSFKTGYSASPYVFAALYADSEDKKDDSKASDLLMFTTATGAVDTLRNVLSFTVSRSGRSWLRSLRRKVPTPLRSSP